jgi:hypothetical protein
MSSQTISGGAGSTPQTLAGQAFSIPYNTTALANGVQNLTANTASVSVTVNNVATKSPDGTTLPGASQIVDQFGGIWTLSGNTLSQTYNGTKRTRTICCQLALIWGGRIYVHNIPSADGQWYLSQYDDTVSHESRVDTQYQYWTQIAGDPRPAASGTLPFYGLNMHMDYTETPQQLVNYCTQTGASAYRIDTEGDSPTNQAIAARLGAIQAINPAIKMLVCITSGPNWTDTEANNYAAGFAVAAQVATDCGPAGITTFECGNELFSNTEICTAGGNPADRNSDYISGTPWNAIRGWLRGAIDGIHSVNASYRAAVNFTIVEIAASDMMWNGTAPDGTTGHPTVQWDVTSWHNYQVYGDLFSINTEAHGSTFDDMAYVAAAYGKPIMITEWSSTSPTEAQNATWITDFMNKMYAHRVADKIESIFWYQVGGAWNQGQFGLINSPTMTAAFLSRTQANPA